MTTSHSSSTLRIVSIAALSFAVGCDASFLHDVETRRDATDRGCPAPNDGAHDLEASIAANGNLTLSWTSSATNADGFLVERQSSREPTWGEIGSVSGSSFTDDRVVNDEEYGYRVSAVRNAGSSVCATPASTPLSVRTAPNAAGALLARGTNVGEITLTWNDVNSFEDGYRVSRSLSGGTAAVIGTLSAGANTFTDQTVAPGTTYTYLLVAFNVSGDSDPSIVSQRAVTPATLSWTQPPRIVADCSLEAFGSAVYDSGAAFASSTGVVDGLEGPGNASGFSVPIDPATEGPVDTTWIVDDTAGGQASLSRTLSVTKTPSVRSARRQPLPGELAGEGLQALVPACATCGDVPRASLSAGSNFTCQVNANGRVACWGMDDYGQLGHGVIDRARVAVRPCRTDASGVCTSSPRSFLDFDLGYDHGCGITPDNHAVCWGYASSLQLGNPKTTETFAETPVCETSGTTSCTTELTNVTDIAAGYSTGCAISNGEVWCWGSDPYDGVDHLPQPVCESGTDPATCPRFTADAVDIYEYLVCARRADRLWCWGYTYTSAFGTDPTIDSPNPIPVCTSGGGAGCVPLTGVADFGVGDDFACAKKTDDSVVCWGSNGSGELGTGSTDSELAAPTPVCITGTPGACTEPLTSVAHLAVAANHTCASRTTGEVYCWGAGGSGQVGSLGASTNRNATSVCRSGTAPGCPAIDDAIAVSAGERTSCAALESGNVICWGADAARGNPELALGVGIPVDVCTDGGGAGCTRLDGALAVSSGDAGSCALTGNGLWCWGANDESQLGVESTPFSSRPNAAAEVQIGAGADAAPLDQVAMVQTGVLNACAVRADRTVWCWGWDGSGTLAVSPNGTVGGRGYARPVCASGTGPTCVPLGGVTSLSVGSDHICASTEQGEVWCWGGDDCGELGRGLSLVCDDTVENVAVPQRVVIDGAGTPLTDVAEVSVGLSYTCALKRSGRIVCFGDNRTGALGGEVTGDSSRYPVDVCIAGGGACTPVNDFVAVRAGLTHACGIRANGTMACWGADRCGQLGNPQRTSCVGTERTTAQVACRSLAAPCEPITDVIEVGVGLEYTCVLLGTGAVSCWGRDVSGELGNGTFTGNSIAHAFAPVVACDGSCNSGCTTPFTGGVSLSAKSIHACVTREDGVAYCWGDNYARPTGADSTAGSSVCDAVASCAAGDAPGCALNDSGEVRVCDALSVSVP